MIPGCGSGGRAGHLLIRWLVIWPLPASVYMPKCPWARYSPLFIGVWMLDRKQHLNIEKKKGACMNEVLWVLQELRRASEFTILWYLLTSLWFAHQGWFSINRCTWQPLRYFLFPTIDGIKDMFRIAVSSCVTMSSRPILEGPFYINNVEFTITQINT